MKVPATLVLFSAFCFATVSSKFIPVIVEKSGAKDVKKFATVISFYLDLLNNGGDTINVTITPKSCCLKIDEGDVNCQVINLGPSKSVVLGPRVDQFTTTNHNTVTFMFRNLYARFRKGHCNFDIESGKDVTFEHTLNFDTYPTSNDSLSCNAIDQDPDRECSPVDCAIKYKGFRNFYRSSTGKCETVIECETRGHDGTEIIAYYDWESNTCHKLPFGENTFIEDELDIVIPVAVDPSQTEYFPNLEAQRLNDMVESEEKLKCNHGVQNGMYCDCDRGWISSGIHEKDPTIFHWCDIKEMTDSSLVYGIPVKPTKLVEVIVSITLGVLNTSLLLFWFFLVYKLFLKERIQKACKRNKEPSYTLLEPK